MDLLSKTSLNNENAIALKCGYSNSIIIGTTYNVSSININSANCALLQFICNLSNVEFIGTINFQVLMLCRNYSMPIPIGQIWTFSQLAAITNSNTFSFFICNHDVCSNECCTYSVVATILDGITGNTTTITDVSNGGAITLTGSGNVIYNGNININFDNPIGFSGAIGTVTITSDSGTISQSGTTVTVNNLEPGSIISNVPGAGTIVVVNGIFTVTITHVNGSAMKRTSTTGTCAINNATLAAISVL
jgi:hypothetical protein